MGSVTRVLVADLSSSLLYKKLTIFHRLIMPFKKASFRTLLMVITSLVVGSNGFGIGGGYMSYGSKGFFPRASPRNYVSAVSRGGPGAGVMYFHDPSPSHLRYPDNSYKTRMEEKQKEDRGSLTRWDWINDMSQQYEEGNEDTEKETKEEEEEKAIMNPKALPVQARIAKPKKPAKDPEAEMILKGLLERIQALNSIKRESRYESALVGPRPPLLLMGK